MPGDLHIALPRGMQSPRGDGREAGERQGLHRMRDVQHRMRIHRTEEGHALRGVQGERHVRDAGLQGDGIQPASVGHGGCASTALCEGCGCTADARMPRRVTGTISRIRYREGALISGRSDGEVRGRMLHLCRPVQGTHRGREGRAQEGGGRTPEGKEAVRHLFGMRGRDVSVGHRCGARDTQAASGPGQDKGAAGDQAEGGHTDRLRTEGPAVEVQGRGGSVRM